MTLPLTDVVVVVTAAAAGLLLGPLLAALTQTVPAGGPMAAAEVLRGRPATARRIVAVAAATGTAFALLAASIGADAALPAFLLMGAVGVTLAVIDTEHHRLPDRLVLPTYVAGEALLLAAATVTGTFEAWVRALLAAAAVFAVFLLLALISPEGFGFGDVKLGGLLGMYLGWLGWDRVVLGVLAGFLIGTVLALVLIVTRRASLRTPVPFGPALLAGALVAVVAGPDLLSAYGG